MRIGNGSVASTLAMAEAGPNAQVALQRATVASGRSMPCRQRSPKCPPPWMAC